MQLCTYNSCLVRGMINRLPDDIRLLEEVGIRDMIYVLNIFSACDGSFSRSDGGHNYARSLPRCPDLPRGHMILGYQCPTS